MTILAKQFVCVNLYYCILRKHARQDGNIPCI